MTETQIREHKNYVKQITAVWQRSVAAIIETGRLLIEAKAKLPHGDWSKLFEGEDGLPFSLRTAERLMAIAGHPFLKDPTHVSLLPPSWGTLYELSKLPPRSLKASAQKGLITPDMTREDVRRRLYERPPEDEKRHARIKELNEAAEAVCIKRVQRARRNYLNEHNRQVADYIDALGMFETALEVAIACRERFADKSALQFIARRHARVVERMAVLVGKRDDLIAEPSTQCEKKEVA